MKNGEDLHSKCAAFIYGPLWRDYAATDCEYYISGQKCNCKKHKELRNNVKSLNFGLAYGMGPGSLAARLEISKEDAKKLISDYFRAFPKIKVFLDSLKQEALDKGYAITYAPFKRKRFFPGWYRSIGFKEPERAGEIGRAGTNLPIQGSSADMTKLALVLVRAAINQHDLPVKLVMQVHDQVDTICREDFAERWKTILTAQMEKAARTVITNGLLKAETSITKDWSK